MPQLLASLITIVVVIHVVLLSVAYLILLERKFASWVQNRIGPNRVGPNGLLQPIADGLKFLLKEDYTPPGVDRPLFLLAPVLAVVPAMVGWAVIPWGGYLKWNEHTLTIAAAPIHVGAIYILAIGSLAVYGVVIGGYASNNKYSFLGGLRATAQMLSYEIPQALCVLIILLMTGLPDASMIVNKQAMENWNIISQPVLAIIFFTCVLAECNRAPFDLAEAEQELVGGYHTEYSSMKFALFFLGEYMHMITGSAFFVLLFLGGWDLLPFWSELPLVGGSTLVGGLALVLLKVIVFAIKVFLMLTVMIWIRWTLPRFRFDQLMKLAWRTLIPLTLVLLLASSVLVYLDLPDWTMLVANIVILGLVTLLGHLLPQGPAVNRRIKLVGSRFSAPETA